MGAFIDINVPEFISGMFCAIIGMLKCGEESMPSLVERLRQLKQENQRREELENQLRNQLHKKVLEEEAIRRKTEELHDKVRKKFARSILGEIRDEYLNGKGDIRTLNDGDKITFPSSTFEGGGSCGDGHWLTGPGDFLIWDRSGNDRKGSVRYYEFKINMRKLLPEDVSVLNQKTEDILLGETTRAILEDQVLSDFKVNPKGHCFGWTDKAEYPAQTYG